MVPEPIPPRNANLNFPMSSELKALIANPNDQGREAAPRPERIGAVHPAHAMHHQKPGPARLFFAPLSG